MNRKLNEVFPGDNVSKTQTVWAGGRGSAQHAKSTGDRYSPALRLGTALSIVHQRKHWRLLRLIAARSPASSLSSGSEDTGVGLISTYAGG